MSPEIAQSAGDAISEMGLDCLVLVTDGTTVSVYARGERHNIEEMAKCAASIDVDSDFETVEEMRVN